MPYRRISRLPPLVPTHDPSPLTHYPRLSPSSRLSNLGKFLRANSCSQTRTTFHPSALSSRFIFRSRALLPVIFASQNAARFFDLVPCLEPSRQKPQPTSTASLPWMR